MTTKLNMPDFLDHLIALRRLTEAPACEVHDSGGRYPLNTRLESRRRFTQLLQGLHEIGLHDQVLAEALAVPEVTNLAGHPQIIRQWRAGAIPQSVSVRRAVFAKARILLTALIEVEWARPRYVDPDLASRLGFEKVF